MPMDACIPAITLMLLGVCAESECFTPSIQLLSHDPLNVQVRVMARRYKPVPIACAAHCLALSRERNEAHSICSAPLHPIKRISARMLRRLSTTLYSVPLSCVGDRVKLGDDIRN